MTIAPVTDSGTAQLLGRAEKLLAKCTTVRDALDGISLADKARHLAVILDLNAAAKNHVTAIDAKFQRQLADLVDQGQEQGKIQKRGGDRTSNVRTPDNAPSLDDIGVDRRRLAEARAIRDNYTDEELDEVVEEANEEGREVSKSSLVQGTAHVQHNSGAIEWYTPDKWTDAARRVMGEIDLDPASCAEANERVGATAHFTEEDNGLERAWAGRVWMNPPYASGLIEKFCVKLVDEYVDGNVSEACVLVNNASETGWYSVLAGKATSLCQPRGRISFWRLGEGSKTPLQGQAIFYFGENVDAFRKVFDEFGKTWIP